MLKSVLLGDVTVGSESETEARVHWQKLYAPRYRRYWGVKVDENGQPDDRDLLRVARTNAVIRIERLGSL